MALVSAGVIKESEKKGSRDAVLYTLTRLLPQLILTGQMHFRQYIGGETTILIA